MRNPFRRADWNVAAIVEIMQNFSKGLVVKRTISEDKDLYFFPGGTGGGTGSGAGGRYLLVDRSEPGKGSDGGGSGDITNDKAVD